MRIIEMITRPDGSLHLAVKIVDVEYIFPLADWVRLAEQIIEEYETHVTPNSPKCCICGDVLVKPNLLVCNSCRKL